MSYFQRYLKYKHKYLTLKNQLEQVGGGCGDDHESKMDVLELESLSDTPQYSEDLEKTLQTGGDNKEGEEAGEDAESASEEEVGEESESAEEENGNESDGGDSFVTTVNGSDSDSSKSDSEPEEQIGGGRFFNNVMDDLSSSIHSFDLQKGGFDSELSPLSDFDIE